MRRHDPPAVNDDASGGLGVLVLSIVAEQSVHHAVSPQARSEVQPPLDALATKSPHVRVSAARRCVNLGSRLESVRRHRTEKILDQLPLRFDPDAMASVLREQRNSDLEVPERADGSPCHPSGARAVLQRNRQERRLTPDESIVAPSALKIPRLVNAKAEPLVLAWRVRIPQEPHEGSEIAFFDGRRRTAPLTASVFYPASPNAG